VKPPARVVAQLAMMPVVPPWKSVNSAMLKFAAVSR